MFPSKEGNLINEFLRERDIYTELIVKQTSINLSLRGMLHSTDAQDYTGLLKDLMSV